MIENMPRSTRAYGIALVVIGVVGYFGSGRVSVTALIPAVLGAIAILCALVARNENYLKHAMHVAVLVGLAGIFGTISVIGDIPAFLQGTAGPAAVIAKLMTLIMSVIFVALSVMSFVRARKARNAA